MYIYIILGAMTPQITGAPVGSQGHKLGMEAFQVLSKNYYYSPKEQQYMADTIAKMSERAYKGK
jgi:hypothetical protein